MSLTWFVPFYVAPFVHFAVGSPARNQSVILPDSVLAAVVS